MKSFNNSLLLLFLITALACVRNDDFPEIVQEDPVDPLIALRETSTERLCSNSSKTWSIQQAILNTGSSEIDVTNNYNIKDDEFTFYRSDETGGLVWKKRYDININAANLEETLVQKYASNYYSIFSYAEGSATEVVTNSSGLSITIHDENTLFVTLSLGQASLQLVLIEKTDATFIQPPSELNFSNAFTFESDLIGAPGMIGSIADNSILISVREDLLSLTPGQSPERIVKFNLDDNSITDYVYHQPGFASRQSLIIGNEALVISGTRINVYDRQNLGNDPMSLEFPVGTAYSRFGTAVQDDQVFLIGGALGNDDEAEENRKKILKFDLNTQSLSDFGTLPEPKSGARSVIVDDQIYIFGGSETLFGLSPTKTIYKVSTIDGLITETFEMNTEVDFTYVKEDEHLIYVAGSKLFRDSNDLIIGREATLGVFNTVTKVYEEIPTNLSNVSGFETIHQMCILNDKMYIIYGDQDVGASATSFETWNVLVADLD